MSVPENELKIIHELENLISDSIPPISELGYQVLQSCVVKDNHIAELETLSNSLTEFPKIVLDFPCLKNLMLRFREISELLADIDRLQTLEELHLRDCEKLTIIPNSIANFRNLSRFANRN